LLSTIIFNGSASMPLKRSTARGRAKLHFDLFFAKNLAAPNLMSAACYQPFFQRYCSNAADVCNAAEEEHSVGAPLKRSTAWGRAKVGSCLARLSDETEENEKSEDD
jgi:hypothetical protein